MTEKSSLWVFLEQNEGRLADVSLELLGKARELAGPLGGEVTGLLLGHKVKELAQLAIQSGADRVLLADHPEFEMYRTLPYARVAIDEPAPASRKSSLSEPPPAGAIWRRGWRAPCAAG